MRLDGETILITGSTSGIGRQAAITCAREGARVAVHGRDAERGAAVVRTITDAGGTAVFLAADLAGRDRVHGAGRQRPRHDWAA